MWSMGCVCGCFSSTEDSGAGRLNSRPISPALQLFGGLKSRCTSPRCVSPAGKQQVTWSELPTGVIARVLASLTFADRLKAALVCKSWNSIVNSAAAHDKADYSTAPSCKSWDLTRFQPSDVCALEEQQQCRLHLCKALRHAGSASIWMCAVGGTTIRQLQGLTRLQLLDIRCDVEGRHFSPPVRPVVSLQHLQHLRILNLGMSSPMVDFSKLPSSLKCLHLNLASGYSVQQLHSLCLGLAESVKQLPLLQHISLGMELDALLSESQKTVLNPLGQLTQLTSLAITDYQLLHPDSPAHEGYPVIPPVLRLLTGLKEVELHASSGQNAQLDAAAAIPVVQLVLTLARHEQVPFSRLPPSLVLLTGLSSLSILAAEFAYDADTDLYMFDVSTLAACRRLHTLLLELHGAKSSQHDLRGLAQLHHLKDLVVFFKCPDVHEARPEVGSYHSRSSGAGSTSSASGDSSVSSMGLSSWLARTTAALRKPGAQGVVSLLNSAHTGNARGGLADALRAAEQAGFSSSSSRSGGHADARRRSQGSSGSCEDTMAGELCEEWVLQLLDTALDQLRPEFALSVPRVAGRMLVATTSRLLLRQPELVTAAGDPMLLASRLQLDCESIGDCWGGECFLHRLSPGALRAWASRHWQPWGVEMLLPARYPRLRYPGCNHRIDDKLLVVAKKGITGQQVVQAIKCTAEERCFTYFT